MLPEPPVSHTKTLLAKRDRADWDQECLHIGFILVIFVHPTLLKDCNNPSHHRQVQFGFEMGPATICLFLSDLLPLF